MDKIDRFFINLPPLMSPNILAFTYLILVFRGMGAGVAIMLDNLDPPPPQEKKEFKKGKTTRFGLAASLVISLRELGGGGVAPRL